MVGMTLAPSESVANSKTKKKNQAFFPFQFQNGISTWHILKALIAVLKNMGD